MEKPEHSIQQYRRNRCGMTDVLIFWETAKIGQ
jgi:hypothetical protein